MRKQYIKSTNLGPILRIASIAFWWMFIDFYNLPEWVWGVYGVLVFIGIVSFFYRIFAEEAVDVVRRDDGA